MSAKATELFIKAAKRYGGIDLSRGAYGEWLAKRTRALWYFWYSAWQARAKDIKRKRATPKPGAAK